MVFDIHENLLILILEQMTILINGDLEITHKEYVDEELLNPSINYPNVKNIYPIQVIDLRV